MVDKVTTKGRIWKKTLAATYRAWSVSKNKKHVCPSIFTKYKGDNTKFLNIYAFFSCILF